MKNHIKENKRLIVEMGRSIPQSEGRVENALIERVKELTCLYGVSQLVAEHSDSIELILLRVPDLLPPSWQYPDITCARVVFDGVEYTSSNFRASKWCQASILEIQGKPLGSVEVYYINQMPEIDEGPFLNEERLLINAIAAIISRAVQRIRSEALLFRQQQALERSHTALKEVLETIEMKQHEIVEHIESNITNVIMPIIYDMKTRISSEETKVHIRLLTRYLEEITLPFSSGLLKEFTTLSPAEIQLCNMVRNGLSSKAIAKLRKVSPSTVYRQRESIRRKLGITNKDVNLTSYLSAYLPQ